MKKVSAKNQIKNLYLAEKLHSNWRTKKARQKFKNNLKELPQETALKILKSDINKIKKILNYHIF